MTAERQNSEDEAQRADELPAMGHVVIVAAENQQGSALINHGVHVIISRRQKYRECCSRRLGAAPNDSLHHHVMRFSVDCVR